MSEEIDIIKEFIEVINIGEKVEFPALDINQLNKIMKGVNNVDNLINSDVANALLNRGIIGSLEDLKEQFKVIKIESDLTDISDIAETNFRYRTYSPDQNVLLNFVNTTNEVDSLLELIDNSLDAITISESGENPYKIHLAFLKKLITHGTFQYSILIKDNGCGITREKFQTVARLGQSGASKEKQSLIGTWGSGLLISGFKLGERITIQTVEEYTEEGDPVPRPKRIYIIDAAYYIETTDPNEMWKVKEETEEFLKKKKDLIRKRGGETWIQIDILRPEGREKEINLLFTGENTFYHLLKDLLIFKLSKKLKSIKASGKNVQIRISAPNIDDILFNNFSGLDDEKFFDYLEHFSFHPCFSPISIKNIPISSEKIERAKYIRDDEDPKIKIKNLIIGLASNKRPIIHEDFVKLYLEQLDYIERNGIWIWGNGRLFTHGIIYSDERWPFDNPNKTTTILRQICVYIELEATNPSGNKLIPWEFPSKRKLEFSVNFKQVLGDIVNPFIKEFRIAIPKLLMPSLNARLFPSDLLKDDIDDKKIEEIITKSFQKSENNPSERSKYDRDFISTLTESVPKLVEIYKNLKRLRLLSVKEWEYSDLITEGANDYNDKKKYYERLSKYTKNSEIDFKKRISKGKKSIGYPPIVIFIRNLEKIYKDLTQIGAPQYSEAATKINKAETQKTLAKEIERNAKNRTREAKLKEERAKLEVEEAKKKEEVLKKEREETLKRVEEAKKQKKLEIALRLEKEAKKKEEKAKIAIEVAKKKEEKARLEVEESNKMEEDAKKGVEEANRIEEEAEKIVEEAKKKVKDRKEELEEETMDENLMMELENKLVTVKIQLLDFELNKIKEITKDSDNSEAVYTIVKGWLAENSEDEESTIEEEN